MSILVMIKNITTVHTQPTATQLAPVAAAPIRINNKNNSVYEKISEVFRSSRGKNNLRNRQLVALAIVCRATICITAIGIQNVLFTFQNVHTQTYRG
ncbi:MAG TPA: hypothetical protein VFI73_04645 [Candidatus Nitrosopolaris sp.]|nr:hypothetical protein [Candidatus Nitrosopolaris sp.]